MKQVRFEHCGLSVTDINRSIDWYRNLFGFEVIKHFVKEDLEIKGATLKKDDVVLEILETFSPQTASSKHEALRVELRRCGLNHFALSVDDAASLYRRLKSAGEVLIGELIDNRLFFCKDPDGTLIEVKQIS